jgi:hypothetical protein
LVAQLVSLCSAQELLVVRVLPLVASLWQRELLLLRVRVALFPSSLAHNRQADLVRCVS